MWPFTTCSSRSRLPPRLPGFDSNHAAATVANGVRANLGSTNKPRSLSTSTVRANRSAFDRRRNVFTRGRPVGSR
jgi:hypothetical protein